MKSKGTKGIIIMLVLAFLVVGYYTYLSNRTKVSEDNIQTDSSITPVQQVLAQNFQMNYPQTPREVLKHYCEITKCFYNEEITDSDLNALGLKIMELYDDELVAKQGTAYLSTLKNDVAGMRSQGTVISGYKLSASTDVKYFTKNDRECAGLYCIFTIRNGTKMESTEELFILRKDGEGHWKILGWDLAEPGKNETGNS